MKSGAFSAVTGIGIGLLSSSAGVILDLRFEYVWLILMFFIVFINLFIRYRLAFIWFVLFSLFGIMNLPIKPFDVFFVCVASVLFLTRKVEKALFRSSVLIHASMGMFLLISCISIIGSDNVREGVHYYVHTLFVVFVFYTILWFVQNENEYKGILWGYCLSSALSAMIVLGELIGVLKQFGTLFQGIRAKGFFLDPNDFSPFLVLSILLLFELYINSTYTSWRYYIYLVLIFLLMIVLLAALSRAAILHFIVSFLIYLFYTWKDQRSYQAISFFFGTLILIWTLFFYIKKDDIIQQLSLRFYDSKGILQGYDFDRFYYQLEGLRLGSTHLFGIGPGQFELMMNYATHNLYIRVIAENGWLAFLCFVLFLLYVLHLLLKHRKKRVWGFPLYLFFSAYVGILINSFFIDTLHWRYLWFLIGMSTVLVFKVQNVTEKVRGSG